MNPELEAPLEPNYDRYAEADVFKNFVKNYYQARVVPLPLPEVADAA